MSIIEFLLTNSLISYCEKPLDALIRRPYYFISNFYFIIFFYLLNRSKNNQVRNIGYCLLLIGIFSGMYDATYQVWAQVLDWAGMFTLVNYLIFMNIQNNGLFQKVNYRSIQIPFLIIYNVLWLTFIKDFHFNLETFQYCVLTIIALEIVSVLRKIYPVTKLLRFGVVLSIFFLGVIFWNLDLTQKYCHGFGLLNGRAVEHLLWAIALYIYAKGFEK